VCSSDLGLLADGFRELPEVKAMVRQMYRETAGKPKAARVQKVVDVKSDNPKHYQATSVLDQVNKQIVERGEKLPNGVLIPDKNGNGEGILTDDHLKALEEAGVIDNGEFGKALLLQSEIEVPTKHGTLLVNKPIEQGRSEQFGGLTENYVVPTKWILKKGRLYLESMDLRQLEKNVDRAVKNKIAKELNLTRKKIYEDIEKSVEIQNKGQSTDAYYESVDPKNWQRRKNFINSVLGQQTTRQLGINPMMKDVSPDLVSGIYRTFAFDRLQSAIKTTGDVVIPFGPTSYYSLRDNLMPQSPRFNRNGELVPEKKAPSFGERFLVEEQMVNQSDPRFNRSTKRSAGIAGEIDVVDQWNLGEIVDSNSVFHETNLPSVRSIVSLVRQGPRRSNLFVSNSIDLALGQGGKSYIIEFDPQFVNGFKSKSVANTMMDVVNSGAFEYNLTKTLPSSIKSIIAPNSKGVESLRKTKGFERIFDFDNVIQTERGLKIPKKQNAKESIQETSPLPTQ
jgi:hypothetical protein